MSGHFDVLMGLGILFTPFVVVLWLILRTPKQNTILPGTEHARPNCNGLTMVGSVDVNGNPFGSVDIHTTNVNGMPMAGGVDALGNSFGTHGQSY
jgi:hypothetical protein